VGVDHGKSNANGSDGSVIKGKDKVLYSNQIQTVKMDFSRFQASIIPTVSQLHQAEVDSELVMHKDCVPYKPFTVKARG
jgi:hypothetical protein